MKATYQALTFAAAILLSGCASVLDEDGALAMVPYRIDDHGLIVVDASVNQQGPFSFALDSGASISSIFYALRDELELSSVPGKMAIVHGAVARGEFAVLDVEQIAIAREVWAKPTIVALPAGTLIAAGIKGVLGIDFLKNYGVAFSAEERVIRLYPPRTIAERSYRGWAVIPLRAVPVGESGAALYFLDLEVDGHQIAAAFDLGSELNLMNWSGARSMDTRSRKAGSRRELSGALESMPIAAQLQTKVVKTANVRWRNETFAIADLAIFSTLDRADSPTAILGVGLFTQRDFIIDLVRSRLLVKVAMDEIENRQSWSERDSD